MANINDFISRLMMTIFISKTNPIRPMLRENICRVIDDWVAIRSKISVYKRPLACCIDEAEFRATLLSFHGPLAPEGMCSGENAGRQRVITDQLSNR